MGKTSFKNQERRGLKTDTNLKGKSQPNEHTEVLEVERDETKLVGKFNWQWINKGPVERGNNSSATMKKIAPPNKRKEIPSKGDRFDALSWGKEEAIRK